MNKQKWKIRKIDGRNKLWSRLKYQIIYVDHTNINYYFDAREWCTEQWGPGIESGFFNSYRLNRIWCWDTTWPQGGYSTVRLCIYLPDDDTLTMFRLRWDN